MGGCKWTWAFPGDSAVENPPANAGDVGLIPGSGRCSGEGYGNPLQNSGLGNPMDRGAWLAIVRLHIYICILPRQEFWVSRLISS